MHAVVMCTLPPAAASCSVRGRSRRDLVIRCYSIRIMMFVVSRVKYCHSGIYLLLEIGGLIQQV
jgi:hypothetical protein